MNTRADRGGIVLELKVEKLGKHETAWRKRRDVQTLAISNLSPLFFLFSMDIGSFLMKLFWCFKLNKKKKKRKGNEDWNFYLATNHANNFSKIIRRNYCKKRILFCFVFFLECETFFPKKFHLTKSISLILLWIRFNSTSPLISRKLVISKVVFKDQIPRNVISPGIKYSL